MGIKKARSALISVQSGICGNYAAEIIFFLFKIAESMLEPTIRLFLYEAICLKELNSHHKCRYLERYPDHEAIVQSISAKFLMYYKILLNAPAVILVLFCGAWSDRSGRKLPVMLTCFGGIVSVILFMLSSQLGHGKGAYLPLILIGAGIRGVFGRSAVMTMACHSYVSDITTKEARTRKLGHLVAMSHFGYLAGCTIAGSLLDTTGFLVVFCIVVFIQTTCFLVASVCMRDKVVKPLDESVRSSNDSDDSGDVTQMSSSGLCDADHLKACFDVIAKPRPGKLKCYIVVLLVASVIQQTCKSGEIDMTLLFVERAPLSWPRSLYSYLLAVDYACLGILGFFILPILVYYCRIQDSCLALIGLVFKLGRTMMLAFSSTTWMVYTAVIIGGPHAFTISGIKSMISKLVDEDEIGKIFSIISSLETISNLFGTVIFTNVYAATLGIWPGFGFSVEAAMYLIMFCLMSSLACSQTMDLEQEPLLDHEQKPPTTSTYGAVDDSLCDERTSSCDIIPPSRDHVPPPRPIPVPPTARACSHRDSIASEVIVYSYDFESSGCVNL